MRIKFNLIKVALAISFLVGAIFLAKPAFAISDASIKPYQAIVKINTYILDKYNDLSLWGSGSGIIIDPSGLVLTNYHVTSLEEEFDNSLRETSFQICLTVDPGQQPDCSYLGQMVGRDKDLDVAILKLIPIEQLASINPPFPYLKLDGSNSINTGGKISVLGYPSIGAETITTTEGIISGKIKKYKKDWLKTDAVISYGNSGGAAVSKDGHVVGLTSEAHADLLGTLGYLINISSLTNWIADNLQKTPQAASFENKVNQLSVKQKELEKSNSDYFQNNKPPYSIEKPHDWDFIYDSENQLTITKKAVDSGGAVQISYTPFPIRVSAEAAIARLKGSLMGAGGLGFFNINRNLPVTVNNLTGNKITFSVAGKSKSVYYFYSGNYLMEINYSYGQSDKDKITVDKIINSLRSTGDLPFEKHITYQNDNPMVSLISNEEWPVMSLNSKDEKARLYNSALPSTDIVLGFSKIDSAEKDFSNEEKLKSQQDLIATFNNMSAVLGMNISITDSSAHFKLNDEINDAIMTATQIKKTGTNELLAATVDYLYKQNDHFIDLSLNMFTDKQSDFDSALEQVKPILESLSLKPLPPAPVIDQKTEPVISEQATTSEQVSAPAVNQKTEPVSKDSLFKKPIFWIIAGVWFLAIVAVLFFLVRNLRRR